MPYIKRWDVYIFGGLIDGQCQYSHKTCEIFQILANPKVVSSPIHQFKFHGVVIIIIINNLLRAFYIAGTCVRTLLILAYLI